MEHRRRVLTYSTRGGSRIVCRPAGDGLLIALPRRNLVEALGDAASAIGGEGMFLLILLAGLVAFALHSVWRSGWTASAAITLTIAGVGAGVVVAGVLWLRRGTRILVRRDELVVRTPGMGERIFSTIERRCRAVDVARVWAERGKLHVRLKDGTHLWDGVQDADWSWDDGMDEEDVEWVAARVREGMGLSEVTESGRSEQNPHPDPLP